MNTNHKYNNNSYNNFNYSQENKNWKKIKWKRSTDIYESPCIFGIDICPTEIIRGVLRNYNFLSVISSLAEYSHRIKSLFLTAETNSYGIYGIRLCKDGEWKEIVVDDNFPCDNIKEIPCFSHGSPNTIWVQLIEKCYAKAYGSYHRIESSHFEHILRDFTGAPIITLDNSNENVLGSLKEALEKQWIVTASAGETKASKDLLKEIGLLPMHSYSILQVIESSVSKMNENYSNSYTNNFSEVHSEYYLKIRNPWTQNEWITDFIDNHKLNKDDIENKPNGCLFMNIKDFKHYFSKIHICKIFDDYYYNSIRLEADFHSYSLIKFKILQENDLSSFISILQPDNFNINSPDKSNYFTSRLILCKINKKNINENYAEEIEYVGGKMSIERESCDERILKRGEYLLYLEVDWSKESNKKDLITKYPFVLSIYSPCEIELILLNNNDYPKILENIYKSCAKKENKVYKFLNEGAPNCYKYSNVTPEGYAYIYLENQEKEATLIEDVKYTKFEGLKLLPPHSGTSYNVRVEPFTSQIILIKQIDISGFNLTYSYHSNFIFSKERLLELTKAKGKKTFRKDTKLNIELDIVVYTYKYSLGLCFYYYNGTSDKKLEETLKIKGSGIHIVDCEYSEESNYDDNGNTTKNSSNFNILVNLEPNQTKVIELKAKKNNWSVQSSVSYKIESI